MSVRAWQPIATAPKDGIPVLLLGHSWDNESLPAACIGKWIEQTREYWEQTDHNTQKRREETEGHWSSRNADDWIDFSVTHWMPLPQLPTEEG